MGAPREGTQSRRLEDGRTPSPPRVGSGTFFCDMCSAVMLNLHCKLTCTRCGYKRDCSDP